MIIDSLKIHKNSFLKILVYFCVVCERSWHSRGHVCFQECVCTDRGAPHGIPNISIPVDVFDVFEAT